MYVTQSRTIYDIIFQTFILGIFNIFLFTNQIIKKKSMGKSYFKFVERFYGYGLSPSSYIPCTSNEYSFK